MVHHVASASRAMLFFDRVDGLSPSWQYIKQWISNCFPIQIAKPLTIIPLALIYIFSLIFHVGHATINKRRTKPYTPSYYIHKFFSEILAPYISCSRNSLEIIFYPRGTLADCILIARRATQFTLRARACAYNTVRLRSSSSGGPRRQWPGFDYAGAYIARTRT